MMTAKKARKMLASMKKKAKKIPMSDYLKKNASKMNGKMTWPEKEFQKMLKELKVKFETQKIVGNKIFDFYIPHLNLLLEVDGDYWHANPDTLKTEKINGMQAKNVRNDKFKDALATTLGFSIERVWENDLKNNYEDVKVRMKKILL